MKRVDPNAKTTTVKNFDCINSFLLNPSMRFCFNVPYEYSFAIMETMTIAKKNFKIAAMYVLKCQIYGKLKIP